MAIHFNETEYQARMTRLQAEMTALGYDAMLLFAQESMYWLTGYDTFGFCFFQCLLVRRDGQMSLLTRSADLRQAQLTSIIEDIHIWTDRADANPTRNLRDLMDERELLGAKVGVEYDTHGLTGANARLLDATLKTFATLEDASHVIGLLRAEKSPAEIAYIRQAALLGDAAFQAALDNTKAGADEGAILAAMHQAIFAGGGDYPGNAFILGSGAEALLCRYKSGRRKLDHQDQLTLEWAGVYRHYHVAYMQTIPIGSATPRHGALYEAAHEALLACRAAMVVGASFGDVFDAHARIMEEHGLAAHRLNACGYSLGARFAPSWMDQPMFYRDNPVVIKQNMVLFAHMIIMDSETGTAMTLGRTYLTGEDGAEDLSKIPLSLIVR